MKRLIAVLVTLGVATPVLAVDLLGSYELAVQNDPELRAAEFRRQAAGEQVPQARASLLPQLSADVGRTLGQSRAEVAGQRQPTSDIDDESYVVELRQNLYSDTNWANLGRARSLVSQADYDFEATRQAFKLRVAERYFAVLTAMDTLEFARAEQTALQRQFEQAEQRFEVGLAAVTDVHEARATYDAARARVITAENTLEDAREALREMTGSRFTEYRQLAEDIPLRAPDPADPAEWVERAILNNPGLEARRLQEDIAMSDVRVARAGHLPRLDAVARLNRNVNNEFVLRDTDQTPIGTTSFQTEGWTVSLQLSIPIFEGFAVNSRTRQARFNLDATGEELEQGLRAVVRETENAYRGVIAGVREVEAFEQAVVSAESALEATQAGFDVGTRTIVDVLQAEQRLFQAKRDYSRARHDYILNSLRLRQAAGILEPEDLARVNALLR